TTHALTTATGIIVTIYVTKAITEKQKTEEVNQTRTEVTRDLNEALSKTSAMLNSQYSRYDELHEKYLACNGSASRQIASREENANTGEEPRKQFTAISNLLLNGSWLTPDQTVVWTFN